MENGIRAAREALGLSYKEVGTRVGTSASQIERLEKGMRRLTRDWAERLSPVLQKTARDLMFPDYGNNHGAGKGGGGGADEMGDEQGREPGPDDV